MANAASVDLRGLMPAVADQGDRPTCVAFTLTADHEAQRQCAVSLSEEHLFWQCKQLDAKRGLQERGTRFDTGLSTLMRYGQVEKHIWPYSDPEPVPYVPPAEVSVAPVHVINSGSEIDPAVSVVQEFIANDVPVAAGFSLYPSLLKPDSGVIRYNPAGDGPFLGRHAMLIVGYHGEDENDPDGYFIVRNSWGTEWGDHGYCYMQYLYYRMNVIQTWVVEL